MTPITDMKLSFVCQENWNSFTTVPGGKFCESCKFIVHDFTDSTAEELSKVIKENPGRICGRFKKTQLRTNFVNRAAIASASLALAACGAGTMPSNSNHLRDIPPPYDYAVDVKAIIPLDSIQIEISTVGMVDLDSLSITNPLD